MGVGNGFVFSPGRGWTSGGWRPPFSLPLLGSGGRVEKQVLLTWGEF